MFLSFQVILCFLFLVMPEKIVQAQNIPTSLNSNVTDVNSYYILSFNFSITSTSSGVWTESSSKTLLLQLKSEIAKFLKINHIYVSIAETLLQQVQTLTKTFYIYVHAYFSDETSAFSATNLLATYSDILNTEITGKNLGNQIKFANISLRVPQGLKRDQNVIETFFSSNLFIIAIAGGGGFLLLVLFLILLACMHDISYENHAGYAYGTVASFV